METDQKTVFYRVAQESLTNISKHAQATESRITLRRDKKGIRMEITDNGKSFRVEQHLSPEVKGKKRLGLLGIQERVRLANGKCEVESTPGKGTRVRIWIPFRIGGFSGGQLE
jgi:signal transduction histidine kinase